MSNTAGYHGIVIAQGFRDQKFPESFRVFAKRVSKSDGWIIYGIEIPSVGVENEIQRIQDELVPDEPWYAHLYNDNELIVIFKQKIFRVTPHQSTWKPVTEYGRTIGIPEEQLDFWPNRFQGETHYFAPEDFLS